MPFPEAEKGIRIPKLMKNAFNLAGLAGPDLKVVLH
jgi:hypothetical protein